MTAHSKAGAALFVALVAAVAGGLISLSHELSRDRIAANRRERLLERLDEVLGTTRYDNDLERSRARVTAPDLLGSDDPVDVFLARRDGAPVAAVFASVAPNGYNGPIDLLVGVSADGAVTGVRVTAHRETPGLGDAIEISRSPWIAAFDGTRLGAPALTDWRVDKDGGAFDALTGATVTPRAVVEAVRNTLIYFRDHRAELFGSEASERADGDD